jgi:hypothetical protein
MSIEVEPEVLELCGYVRVHQIMLGDGQSVSFHLVNGWEALAVTSAALGGEGSALGMSREVIVWALSGKEGVVSWRYSLTIQLAGEDLYVIAMKSAVDGGVEKTTSTGVMVALDPPTPMEMLAAQAMAMTEEEFDGAS